MDTRVVSPKGKEVIIGDNQPTILIGERINPFGKGLIKEGMLTGNMEPIAKMAIQQVQDGADILIISVAAFGIDENVILPKATAAIVEAVDVPLCLESRNPIALEAALRLGCGKPIISSITGEETHLKELLPLVQQYETSLEIIASDARGIPDSATGRLEILVRIAERAKEMGISPDRLLADCIAESSAVSNTSALLTMETMEMVKHVLGINLVLGASNVSFGLPERPIINAVFLSLAIRAGLNCAIVNAAKMKPYIMAADLLIGRDHRARRYTGYHRAKVQNSKTNAVEFISVSQ